MLVLGEIAYSLSEHLTFSSSVRPHKHQSSIFSDAARNEEATAIAFPRPYHQLFEGLVGVQYLSGHLSFPLNPFEAGGQRVCHDSSRRHIVHLEYLGHGAFKLAYTL